MTRQIMGDKFGLLQASFGWLAKLTTRLAAEDDLQGLDEVGAELLCLSARVRARNFTRHQLWRLEQDDRIEQALSEVENAISVSSRQCSDEPTEARGLTNVPIPSCKPQPIRVQVLFDGPICTRLPHHCKTGTGLTIS